MDTEFLSNDTIDREVDYEPIGDVDDQEVAGFEEAGDPRQHPHQGSWIGRQIVTALKMATRLVIYILLSPYRCVRAVVVVCIKLVIKLLTKIYDWFIHVTEVIGDFWSDIKKGFWWVTRKCSLPNLVAGITFLVASSSFVGPLNVLIMIIIFLAVVGVRFGYKVPAHLRHHLTALTREWGKLSAEDATEDFPVDEASSKIKERFKEREFPAAACKVAVRAISSVGLLKPTEANAMVYQRVCLDVMEGLRFRHYDRLRILPLAVLACLERPEEVEEVETVVGIITGSPSHYSE